MQLRRITLLIGLVLLTGSILPLGGANGQEQQDNAEDIWEDEPRPPRYPWWYRWLSDDVIDRIMKGIRERDPAKADELARLRKRDPERFKAELGRYGAKEIEEISRERFEARRLRRQAEFLKWLKANYPQDEENLARVQEKDPQLYVKTYEHLQEQYGRIFEADISNPELGAVLKEDFELRRRRNDLVRQLRHERSDAKKQAIGAELAEVVARRYDLIVRGKEIAYEQLQKKLEDLQRQLKASKDEIVKWQDPEVKQENVRRRLEALTRREPRFRWD